MKKQIDFFSMYHSQGMKHIYGYIVSGIFSACFAFGIVFAWNTDIQVGSAALMANVSQIEHKPSSVSDGADMLIQRNHQNIGIVFAAGAERVDSIEFTLLADPQYFKKLVSSSTDISIQGTPDLGTYRVHIDLHGGSLTPGQSIGLLTTDLDETMSLAISDAVFMSQGKQYDLSTQIQTRE